MGSISVGSAGSAHSLVASLGFIVASGGAIVAGTKAPGIVLLAFVPMFFIALAYQQLNRAEPDCGTTFTWATRALSRAPPMPPEDEVGGGRWDPRDGGDQGSSWSQAWPGVS